MACRSFPFTAGVGVDEQRKTEETDRRYRREIAHRVVRQRLEQRHADRVPLVEPQERITVGLGLHRRFRGDDLAGARPVVDDELLAELLRELLPDHARGDVGDPARCVGEQDLDRLRGIILRERDGAEQRGERHVCGEEQRRTPSHPGARAAHAASFCHFPCPRRFMSPERADTRGIDCKANPGRYGSACTAVLVAYCWIFANKPDRTGARSGT